MSKMKLLLDVVEDMRRLADSLQSMADSISGNTVSEEQAEPQREQQPIPKVSIDQVRAVLAEKSSEGKTAQVKELLYKYDAGKLSGVKPEDYPALLEEAQKL
ncbi:MAG: rRNA biogenesis protein rrp5 [Clostridia bacterium]|nr:rRNA biogenesis protein rrp5 [Clostridia bacterium]